MVDQLIRTFRIGIINSLRHDVAIALPPRIVNSPSYCGATSLDRLIPTGSERPTADIDNALNHLAPNILSASRLLINPRRRAAISRSQDSKATSMSGGSAAMHSVRVLPFDMQASIRGTQGGVPGTYPVSEASSGCWSSGAPGPDLSHGSHALFNTETVKTSNSRTRRVIDTSFPKRPVVAMRA